MDLYSNKILNEYKELVQSELNRGCAVEESKRLLRIYNNLPKSLKDKCNHEKELLLKEIKSKSSNLKIQ